MAPKTCSLFLKRSTCHTLSQLAAGRGYYISLIPELNKKESKIVGQDSNPDIGKHLSGLES
jgi:hypothetical protein